MKLFSWGQTARCFGALLACCWAMSLANVSHAEDPASPASELETNLKASLDQLQAAFNAHDAQAVASFWEQEGIHRQATTGDQIKGRDAILKAYTELFQSDPNAKLIITLNAVREVSPTVADVKCSTQLMHSDRSISYSKFSALLVKQGDKWLLDHVEEFDVVLPVETAAGALSKLGWMVGVWGDNVQGAHVSSKVHWASGGNFLIREYKMVTPQGIAGAGTQVIGWDGEHDVIRCWQFDGDGSFGEGTWQETSQNIWHCPMVVKLTDGRRAAFTQVIERVSDKELKLTIVNMEVDGLSLPNVGPDRLVRQGN
ncbi:SgcJ/EcaC family oxidoreductase [Bremerella cremea]|uniref:YybH family protein n=1 Tax=Bremerella cremea TaxID=1031537 RepID=UPI0031F14800